jgi:hypothetical protein
MTGYELQEKIGLVPILRAGLGMVEGIWELMPGAEVWHIGLYRDEKTLRPVEYYNKLPLEPTVSVCLVLDPMLATGGSATATVAAIRQVYWQVSGMHKLDALTRILEVEAFDAMLVFARTKQATVELVEKLEARGFASAALNGWQEYGRMMGGFYGSHILKEVAIKVDEPKHPVVVHLGGKTWKINDEIYMFREPHSPENLRVLLSLDLSQMEDPGNRPDKTYAVSWVSEYGKGRVFYTTLGHVAATHWNPLFLEHLLAGIQFAIGDLRVQPREP